MFAKWLEEYQKLSRKTRFISQLAAFLVSLFSFLSLYDLVKIFSENPQYLESFIEEAHLISSVIFQVSILIIFSVRFVLTFFDREKYFWLNQILWILGITLLAGYWFASRPSGTAPAFGLYETYTGIFRNASRYFDGFGMWYLILSPTRRFIMFIYSLIKVGRNKI